MYRVMLGYTGKCLDELGYARMSGQKLGKLICHVIDIVNVDDDIYSSTSWYSLAYPSTSLHILAYPSTSKHFPVYPNISWYILAYPSTS